MNYKNWQDEYGFIHVQENPTVNGSENSPLFTAELELLFKLNNRSALDIAPKWDMIKENDTKFRDRAIGIPMHFSHDNMTGLYIARELGFHNMELPIIRWDTSKPDKYSRKYWLHPRDIIFYNLLKGNLLGFLLAPILFLIAIHSLLAERGKTSGKCMWFSRFGCLSLSDNGFKAFIGNVGLSISNLLLRREHGSQPFKDVFSIYFVEEHPVNVEIRRYYDNK